MVSTDTLILPNIVTLCWRLRFASAMNTVWRMSTKAQAVVEQIKSLPPSEQDEVCEEIVAFRKRHQREAVERLRGATAGKSLLNKLLAERARERARG